MNVFTMKGRNELSGSISGTMYLIEENGKNYYYLINILNPSDIHFLTSPSPSSRKLKQLNEEEVPQDLIVFHTHITSGTTLCSIEKISNHLRQEQEQKEMESLQKFLVHDIETTRYVISQIGNDFKQIVLVCKKTIGRGETFTYLLDDKWKVKIFEYFAGGIDRTIINVQEERQAFAKKVKNLMSQTHMPWNICKCFVDRFSEEEAIRILQEIKEDRNTGYAQYIFGTEHYIWDLYETTSVHQLIFLSEKKKQYIFNYVCNLVD